MLLFREKPKEDFFDRGPESRRRTGTRGVKTAKSAKFWCSHCKSKVTSGFEM